MTLKTPPPHLALSLSHLRRVGYDAGSQLGWINYPTEVDPKPDVLTATINLGLGVQRLRDVTYSHQKTQVGEFYECDSLRLSLRIFQS